MFRKGLCILLSICLVLSLVPTAVLADAANINILTEGFPETWVSENQSVKISADNSKNEVQSMTVNGKAVTPSGNVPYYLLKQISFENNTLTMGVYMGNHAANGGQFAFTYDISKLQPVTEIVNDFYTGADGITLIKKTPTETRAGSAYLDTAKGNGYVTWVLENGTTVGGANAEVELLKMSFSLKDGVALSDLGADTFGVPAVSDLYKPSMHNAASLTICGTEIKTDLKQNVWLNDVMYGDRIFQAFVFEGETNGNQPFVVTVIDKNGNTKTETIPVKVDLIKTLEAPTFDVSEDHTTVTISNVACATAAPSGISFRAELYVGGQKIDEGAVTNGTASFTAPEGVTATVKVIALSGVGATGSNEKNIFVPILDRIGPEITVAGLPENEWSNADVTFTVSAADPSGIRDITVDGTAYTGAITATESKIYTIVATDNENNSTQKQIEIKIDKKEPTADIYVSDVWGKTNTITILPKDTDSGVKEVKVGDNVLSGTVYTATVPGTYKVQVTDNAGNCYQTSFEVTKIDSTNPTAQITVSTEWGQTNTISVTPFDMQSGVKQTEIDGNIGNSLTVTENRDYPVKVTDNAGNVYETVATVTKVDREKPEVEISTSEGWVQECVISVSARDARSGVKEIKIDGEVRDTLTVIQPGDVTVEVADHAGNIFRDTVFIGNVDREKPVISIGEYPTENVKEIDISFTATDTLSDIASVTVNGTPVTATEGVYSFLVNQKKTYTIVATDNAGNVATESIFAGFLDLEAPTIVSITGNPESWTNRDAVLTITTDGVCDIFFAGEWIAQGVTSATATVTQNGTYKVAVQDAAGNRTEDDIVVSFIDKQKPKLRAEVQQTWGQTNTITVYAEDEDSDIKEVKVGETVLNGLVYTAGANGNYILTATDNAGNVTQTDVMVEKVDTTKPTFEVTEVNDTPCRTFTFEIDAHDEQSGIETIYVNGNPIQGTSYVATADGLYTFSVKDAAGNESDIKYRDLNAIDDILPSVISVSGNPESWTKGEAEITVVFSEVCASVSVDGEAVTANADSITFTATESKTYSLLFTDVVGNQNNHSVSVTYLDNTAPEIEEMVQDTWGKTNLISVSAQDMQSGVQEIKIGNTVTNSLSVSENGPVTITVTDNVGNVATKTVEVTKVDTTAPTADISEQADWGQTSSITVTPTDSQSGVASVTVGGLSVTEVDGKYVYTATENSVLPVIVTDHAGNVFETTASVTKVDTQAPELDISEEPNAWYKEHIFTITATDDLSGVKEITVDGTPITDNSYKATQNGTYNVKATDYAGNIKEMPLTVTKADAVSPVFDGEISVSSLSETGFTVQLPAATDSSGVTYTLKINGETKAYDGAGSFVATNLTINTEYAVEFTATDAAGNSTVLTQTVKTAGLGKVQVAVDLTNFGTEALLMTATVDGVTKDIDSTGKALFENLAAGEHTVKIEGAGYLAFEKKVMVENGKETALSVNIGTDFRPGDMNNDAKIDIKDFNIIGSYYDENCSTAITRACDLNRDGKVDGKDVTFFLKGFVK